MISPDQIVRTHRNIVSILGRLSGRIEGRRILDVGSGVGVIGRILRRGMHPERVDAIEADPALLCFRQEDFYDNVETKDVLYHLDLLKNYDLIILDGLSPHLPPDLLLCFLDRCRYESDVLYLPPTTPIYEKSSLPRAGLMPKSLIDSFDGIQVVDGLLFGKREERPSVLIRTYERFAMAKASLDSLLRSWLPPSTLILVDDGSSDQRLLDYLDSLESMHHKKLLVTASHSGELHRTAQIGVDMFHKISPTPEYLIFADSDFVYHPQWFQRAVLSWKYLTEKEPERRLLAATAFHLGPNHMFHHYGETSRTPFCGVCYRRNSGWGNLIVRGEEASKIEKVDPKTRDTGYIEKVLGKDGWLVGTIPSYVQHIGAKQSTMGHLMGDWAPDFVGSEIVD